MKNDVDKGDEEGMETELRGEKRGGDEKNEVSEVDDSFI